MHTWVMRCTACPLLADRDGLVDGADANASFCSEFFSGSSCVLDRVMSVGITRFLVATAGCHPLPCPPLLVGLHCRDGVGKLGRPTLQRLRCGRVRGQPVPATRCHDVQWVV